MDALRMSRARSVHVVPDARRVIARPFLPREEIFPDGSSRMHMVLERILAMPESEVGATVAGARDQFSGRHRDLDAILEQNFELVAARLGHRELLASPGSVISTDRRRLIGAYFTHEYAIEAAALGNPSIVVAPDQAGLEEGEIRFVMSLRAIGEGHTSSIEFRTGVVTATAEVRLDVPGPYATAGVHAPRVYDQDVVVCQLDNISMMNGIARRVLARLPTRFTMSELEAAIVALDHDGIERSISAETTQALQWLTSSNYRTTFAPSIDISERVLFPQGPTESHGMEDARFVRFVDDDGSTSYLATYTAFDGHRIRPQLIETTDFADFRVTTLTGRVAHNKGMAIFPRRIAGQVVALGRHDNVSNFVMTSMDMWDWRDAVVIQDPEQPWELMQLGNCGSPLETEAGWLVVTHGVGPLRRYTLGALLLDLDDPTRVLGHLKEPLLSPADDERDGYVPNVVYSCGSLIHADHLVLPYGYADVGARVATVGVADLLERLLTPSRRSDP